MATLQVVPALAGRPFPMSGRGVAAARAADWILEQRGDDGSFLGSTARTTVMATCDAVLALAALGYYPDQPAPSGRTASDFLREAAPDFAAQSPRSAGRLALALIALGHDPHAFGGVDVVAHIEDAYNRSTGAYGQPSTWNSAWAILGLVGSGANIPENAVDYLRSARATEGGWGAQIGADEIDGDSTGIALQALAAVGVPEDDPAIWLGVEALRLMQNDDAAFAGRRGASDASSTGRALSGLVAANQTVEGPGWMRSRSGRISLQTPVDGLLELQDTDGSFGGAAGAGDPETTYVAALGLALDPLPIARQAAGQVLFLPFSVTRY
jgi:hypothetical protein